MLECGIGRSWVALRWDRIGSDLSVTLLGGETPHIGAASLAFFQDDTVQVQTSVIPGHKEGAMTHDYAQKLASLFKCTVLVNAGIHIDRAAPQEIELLCQNAEALFQRLLRLLTASE